MLALGLAVGAVALGACSQPPRGVSHPIAQSSLEIAHRNAISLAMRARLLDEMRQREMGRRVRVRVLSSRARADRLRLRFEIENRRAVTLVRIDGALIVRRAGGRKRIGLIELRLPMHVAPRAKVILIRTFRYAQFGEDMHVMQAAAAVRKRFHVTVTRLAYADGQQIGKAP